MSKRLRQRNRSLDFLFKISTIITVVHASRGQIGVVRRRGFLLAQRHHVGLRDSRGKVALGDYRADEVPGP
jgi:hypothetical protein